MRTLKIISDRIFKKRWMNQGNAVSGSRELGAYQLTLLGIGAMIGVGIFVMPGTIAAKHAGPAVVLSFILAGIAALLSALCYCEFAGLVPKPGEELRSGSAYTYAYATLGEVVAWVIGWDLVLEYALGCVLVSIGWAKYLNSLFGVPTSIHVLQWDINFSALGIALMVMVTLLLGIRETKVTNTIMVWTKLMVVLALVATASPAVNTNNWTPFIPEPIGPDEFGWSGIITGAGIVFAGFIGFDAICTAAGDAKNPSKDVPRAILFSLLLCTVLYVLVAVVMTGVVNYKQLDAADPIIIMMDHVGIPGMTVLVNVGVLAGLSSVVLVMMYGQTRILYTMASDGLLPSVLAKTKSSNVPWVSIVFTGITVAMLAARLSFNEAGELVSIGTLFAFFIVSVGVLVLRVKQPTLNRTYKVPAIWLVAPLNSGLCLYLMSQLHEEAWYRLGEWFLIGICIYGMTIAFDIYGSNATKE